MRARKGRGDRGGILERLFGSLRWFRACCSSPLLWWEPWWALPPGGWAWPFWQGMMCGAPCSTGQGYTTLLSELVCLGGQLRAWKGQDCHCRANSPLGKLQGCGCGTLDNPAGATTERSPGQTLATGSFAIWSYSEKPKEFLLPCHKNLHSFLLGKAGWIAPRLNSLT